MSAQHVEAYRQQIVLIAELHAFFVGAVATSLFIIVCTHQKLNWTISFLFLNALVVVIREAITIGVSFMAPGTAPWPHALLLGQCIKLLGDLSRSIYLYKRCSPLIERITYSRTRMAQIRTLFWFLVFWDIIAQGFHYFHGSSYILWTDGHTYVWVNKFYSVTARVISLWTDNLVDLLSCVIVVVALLGAYPSKTYKDNSGWHQIRPKIGLILRSSECRICYVLLLGVGRTVLVFIYLGGEYGTLEYALSIVAQKYGFALFLIFLLVDSAVALLYPAGENETRGDHLDSSSHGLSTSTTAS